MYIHARIQEFSSLGGGGGVGQARLIGKNSDFFIRFFVSPQLVAFSKKIIIKL